MITIQLEDLKEVLPELIDLLDSHYEELTLNKDRVKLNPVWSRYFAMVEENKFFAIIARDENKPIGYAGFILDQHLHYADLIVAANDVLFIHPDYRKGMFGVKFLKFCEKTMKDLGAMKLTWHIKHSNDFRPILNRMKYEDEDIISGKFL
jgi:GNAT superfamily N-acetyltransferase